jgi:hypothetical protein
MGLERYTGPDPACVRDALGPFLLGGRYRVLAELGHSPFQKQSASKTQFNGVGRLRTYIRFTHSAF